MERVFILILMVLASASAPVSALAGPGGEELRCPLRILHTNDMHSHLDHGNDPNLGGYARVKAELDRLKADSRAHSIPVLTLDAGDFLEGSEFYFAERGKRVFEVMDHMGYDAVTIGNHDWLMGVEALDGLVGMIQPHFQFLGANFEVDASQANLSRWMKPYAQFERGGAQPVKIAVLGLTTNEFFYSWRVKHGHIGNPVQVALDQVPWLRQRNDFVIALTHLGVGADIHLVTQVPGLDLVVGGHSHTLLGSPVTERDPWGRYVPILQAGNHGEWVGDLLADACPGQPLRVVSYELHQISHDLPEDSGIAEEVASTRQALISQFGGPGWWDEVVGVSQVPLQAVSSHVSEWSDTVTDAFRELAGAQLSIDLGFFGGISQPAGPIRRGQIAALYPHVFEFDGHPEGWTVWTAKVPGYFLRLMIDYMLQQNMAFAVSGMTVETALQPGASSPKLVSVRVGGKPLSELKTYSIALPETLVRGPREISSVFKLFLRHPRDTGVPIWSAIEQHLRSASPIGPETFARVRARSAGVHGSP